MPLIAYKEMSFAAATKVVIDQANQIIREYGAQGFDLTLRQLYYQFVSRDLIANSQKEYKRLGDIVNNARLAGLIDWDHITDRTRNLRSLGHWGSPAAIILSALDSFQTDKWASQAHRVEVWIEKDALVGVVAGVCNRLDVPFFSCRGYTSQSEMWEAGQRMLRHFRDGKRPRIIHLGDHDPSGIDMSRDIQERIELFTGGQFTKSCFVRIALNRDQIDQYAPPPNPAKTTDSRYETYIAKHGDESWELDALDPRVISTLIQDQVMRWRNESAWTKAVKAEAEMRKDLELCSGRWPEVRSMLRTKGGA